MKKKRNDGKALERAVSLIQQAVLESVPGLKGSEFTVELNKRVNVAGCRLEFDVYVVTHPNTSYQAIVVFECKDWSKPLSAGEVMKFKEKVDKIAASRGIFVARTITKDAEALLATYPRLQFKRCSEEIASMLSLDLLHRAHEPVEIKLRVTAFDPSAAFPADLAEGYAFWNNRMISIAWFGHAQVEQLANADKSYINRKYDEESVHWTQTRKMLEFEKGEFKVAGISVSRVELDVSFFVYIMRHSPRYLCSVDGEGHVISYELNSPDFPEGKLSVNVVITDRRQRKTPHP